MMMKTLVGGNGLKRIALVAFAIAIAAVLVLASTQVTTALIQHPLFADSEAPV